MRFALADALDLWGVQGIDLAAALATLLLQHAPSQEQGPYERFPSIPRTETAVIRHFQERMPYGLFVADVTDATA